jgi:hypothetical protein
MPVLEFFRQYTLREYTAVLLIALMGGIGVVFLLSTASGGGAASGEVKLVKRETAKAAPAVSVRSLEAQQAVKARRAKERARILAERRRIEALRAKRAARRAAVLARARAKAAARTRVVRTPSRSTRAPTRVVNRAPAPAPAARPQPAPAPTPTPKPSPKKSGAGGGGGGSFDDSG